MKTYTKKKYAGQRRSMQRTGGGPPDIQPEAVDQIILSTISESALSGHSDSQESSARLISKFTQIKWIKIKYDIF